MIQTQSATITFVASHLTPVGTLHSKWNEFGLHRLTWAHSDEDCSRDKDQSLSFGCAVELDEMLDEYFQNGQQSFSDVKIDESTLTPFTRRVYAACRAIPVGETVTYGQLATVVGSHGASRAVGSAMSRNRVPIIIPCHRVVGSDGKLCGFSAPGGLATKRNLLSLERYHTWPTETNQ